MENRIKVMVFEPLKEPYIENIKNVPEAYKSIVEGETEEVRLDEKTLLICNSEGKEKELVPNRTIGNDIICGTFFLATDTGSDKEMTFKYDARYLRYDCGRCYSTWNMPCLARGTFEDLYGRGAELYPTDITKITYGRKVIYEKE